MHRASYRRVGRAEGPVAIAAAYALLISTTVYREVSIRQVYSATLASARSSAFVGILIGGALVFNYVIAVENIPTSIRLLFENQELSALEFLLLVNIILLVLGCVLEGITILLVVVPIFIPTAQALGIDMVHFGVVVVNLMIGLVTPPYGLLLFVVSSIARTSLVSVIRDILPFIAALIGGLVFITLVPAAVLWLPRIFCYSG